MTSSTLIQRAVTTIAASMREQAEGSFCIYPASILDGSGAEDVIREDPNLIDIDATLDLRQIVKAVLVAIREATPVMTAAAEFSSLSTSVAGEDSFDFLGEADAAAVWQTMIDAELALESERA